ARSGPGAVGRLDCPTWPATSPMTSRDSDSEPACWKEGIVIQKTPLTIQVDPRVAEAYATAPEADREKMELLLGLHLKDLIERPRKPLRALMDEIGREAASRGITPEILDSILRDD